MSHVPHDFSSARTQTGYLHPLYAQSLAEFGTPRLLTASGGSVLVRQIADSNVRDAMGCYPFFSCVDWARLDSDLKEVGRDIVSISLVTDPFGGCSAQDLQECFPQKMVPFKRHFVADLSLAPKDFVSTHHRHYAGRALKSLQVERCEEPLRFLDEWVTLYSYLIARHQLKGIKAFSREAFATQLTIPGIVMLRALDRGQAVGAHLWYVQQDVAHSHLAAFNARGYELMASYALYHFAIETFAGQARWLNFGSGAGLREGSDGLTWFKKGWSTETRFAYLCGRVFDEEAYRRLLTATGRTDNHYFPGYRTAEF